LIIGAILALLAGAALLGYGVHAMWLNAKIRSLETVPIQSVGGGAVEIQGKAFPLEAHFSPIQQRPCVYWHYRVELYTPSMGGDPAWRIVDERRSADPFWVQDETGKVLVDPRGADLEIPMRLFVDSNTKEGVHRECVAFAESRGMIPRGAGFDRRTRFAEWTVEPDDRIFVFGAAGRVDDATARSNPGARWVLRSGALLRYLSISEKSRRYIVRVARRHAWPILAGGVGLLLVGAALLLRAWK